MNLKFISISIFTVFVAQNVFAKANVVQSNEWLLAKNKITYIVIHPLHRVEGMSESAKGKGVCNDKGCEFLMAAPVKSFDSGNSNRDTHMWQTTKAEQFPMATVTVNIPNDRLSGKQKVDLTVGLAGKSKTVPGEITISNSGDDAHISASFAVNFSDFAMERPSLLAVPVKEEIRILVDGVWSKSSLKN